MLSANGYKEIETRVDLQGKERMIKAQAVKLFYNCHHFRASSFSALYYLEHFAIVGRRVCILLQQKACQ